MSIRILLIDDDTVDRMAVRRALRLTGLEADVREAADGARGIQMLQEEMFDCVLLDYRLPDMDALAFLDTLSTLPPETRVPTIVLTGQGSEAIAVDTMKHGAHDYLVKDEFKPEALQRAILNAIEVTRLQRAHAQAQEALQQQREWYEVTLNSIGDAVITTDVQGRITFLNPVAAALTGWAVSEALGRPVDEVFRMFNEQMSQPVSCPVTQVLQEGQMLGLANHTALLTRDGREIAIVNSAAPIRSSDGKLHGVVLIFHDVSAQKRMEEEILRARKIESIGVLAGGLAHDFNNLLTGIMGNISIAKTFGGADERLVQRLTEAEKACQRATTLTQQLLTFAKGGAPVRQTVSIADLLRESIVFALRGSNVRANLAIAEDLWPVDADPGQFSQVMHNVVLNAAQAMPAGGTVRVCAENIVLQESLGLPLQEGRYLKITVTDYGHGIPADVLPNIFDPYFTTKEHGNGLGLATAYAIVTKHDGYITAASTPGVETTFSLYFPASTQPLSPAQEVPALPRRGTGRILIMDDEESICELLGVMLSNLGYDTVCTRDGAEAIAAYQHAQATDRPFAAMILDITVPGGVGGKDVIAYLQTLTPQVKAIISSGYANDPIMADFAQHGFSGVIVKPYTVEKLHDTLLRVLQG